jgi:hypothetical protein
LESTRDVRNEVESQKTGKVTVVAAVMTVFKKVKGSLRSATKKSSYLALNSKDLASKKTKMELKLAKTRPAWASKPKLSRSMGLIARKKAIRVLLDSGSRGDLLFMRKGASKYVHMVKRVTPQSWGTSNGAFITICVGDIEIAFVDYSESKRIRLRPDIVEYSPGESVPVYDLIIGKETMHELGVILDFKEKTIQIDEILLPMRNILNLQLKPSITRVLKTNTCLAQEPVSTRTATKHVVEILDAKYEKADIPAIVRENCSHLCVCVDLVSRGEGPCAECPDFRVLQLIPPSP